MGSEVIIGDCVDKLREMEAESIDLVVTDPPYNIGINYGFGVKADKRADYQHWCSVWLSECHRVLKKTGSIWVVSGQEYGAAIDLEIQNAGFHFRNRITWQERFGVYCRNKFGRTSRSIFYATKSKLGFCFNRDSVLIPSDRQVKYGDKRANPEGKVMGDVWDIPRVCGTFKERIPGVPTQLPEKLIERIILVSSHPGDIILDPFMGSGTVSCVGVKNKRNTVGIELNPQFAAIATQRLLKHTTRRSA